MELEEDNNIPFLDVLIHMKQDGHLGHQVYRKKTHTESYLHAISHHHPTHKMGVLNTLALKAIRIYDEEHLEKEKDHLTKVFNNIGYKNKDIRMAIRRAMEKVGGEPCSRDNHPSKIAHLPYIKGVTDRISKVLRKKEITTSFKPVETIRQKMRSVKDKIDHHQYKGVYKVEFSCGKCYIGETWMILPS
jgi:hypothetical protein